MLGYCKAKEILKSYYKLSFDKCADNEKLITLDKHKYMHSLHVYDIGKKIIKNEIKLKNLSEELIKIAEISLLLHDIGRFDEAIDKSNNKYNYSDHSILGYEILKNIVGVDDLRLLLSVKHHGHLAVAIDDDKLINLVNCETNKIFFKKAS